MDKQERMDAVYRCFCEFLDGEELHYQTEENEGEDKHLHIAFGGAMPLHVVFSFEAKAERIYVGSLLPFTAEKERIDEMVAAVMRVNQIVAVGTFCFSPESGACTFESTETLAGVGAVSSDYPARVTASVFAAILQFGAQLGEVARGERAASEIDPLVRKEEDE